MDAVISQFSAMKGLSNLGCGASFTETWRALDAILQLKPLLQEEELRRFQKEGVLTLHSKALAESIELDPRYISTPQQRPYGNDIPINTVADHALLAVACQLVRYMPDDVCQVQAFSELYGGRLITDIIPETNHLDFNGELRRIDHTQEEEHGMRLHVDDVDHMLRAPWQLLLGIKNVHQTTTSVAVVPCDEELQRANIDTEVLRQCRFRHMPPKIIDVEGPIPLRPVLYGPKDQPRIQGDWKNTWPDDEVAATAWAALHKFLKEGAREICILPGTIILMDNTRLLHSRAPLKPVAKSTDRRWVKRLWLSSTRTELQLLDCHEDSSDHARVFSRSKAFCACRDLVHPPITGNLTHRSWERSQ